MTTTHPTAPLHATRLLHAPCEAMTVDASGWHVPLPIPVELDERLVDRAALDGRRLPIAVDAALHTFASRSHRSGALLVRSVPIGALPPTPPTPTTPVDKDLATELVLLTVARRLGQPIGYVPEHGGRIVQNIVPTADDADRQTSTSSRST